RSDRDWSSDVCSSDLGKQNRTVGQWRRGMVCTGTRHRYDRAAIRIAHDFCGIDGISRAVQTAGQENLSVFQYRPGVVVTRSLERSEERRVGKEARCTV